MGYSTLGVGNLDNRRSFCILPGKVERRHIVVIAFYRATCQQRKTHYRERNAPQILKLMVFGVRQFTYQPAILRM